MLLWLDAGRPGWGAGKRGFSGLFKHTLKAKNETRCPRRTASSTSLRAGSGGLSPREFS